MGENSPEFAYFPPQEYVIAIPLTDSVEIADVGTETPKTPEEKVDTFLETHSPDFTAIQKAWDNVEAGEKSYSERIGHFLESRRHEPRMDRRKRGGSQVLRQLTNIQDLFDIVRSNADKAYAQLLEDIDASEPLGSQHRVFVERLQENYNTKTKEIHEHVQNSPDFMGGSKNAGAVMYDAVGKQGTILAAIAYARFREDIALRDISAFLADDQIVIPFMRRLRLMAESPERTPAEQSLLELLATSGNKAAQEMLLGAIERASPPSSAYAPELMQTMMQTPEKAPAEIAGIAGALVLAAEVAEAHGGLSRQDFMRLYIGRLKHWTPMLRTQLVSMANEATKGESTAITAALLPFLVKNRLPVEAASNDMEGLFKSSTPKRGSRSAPQTPTNPKPQPNKKVDGTRPEKREQEPITHFAVLQKTGTKSGYKSGEPCTLTPVETVEEVFAYAELDKYIEDHREDQTVRPMLEAAIEHLTTVDPKDPIFTRPYLSVLYRVADADIEARNPRRFKPNSFPGIKKDKITRDTRLIYDVLTFEGQPTLVVYGAFPRDELHSLSQLPRRR